MLTGPMIVPDLSRMRQLMSAFRSYWKIGKVYIDKPRLLVVRLGSVKGTEVSETRPLRAMC